MTDEGTSIESREVVDPVRSTSVEEAGDDGAGDDCLQAVFFADDDEYPVDRDLVVTHYDVDGSEGPTTPERRRSGQLADERLIGRRGIPAATSVVWGSQWWSALVPRAQQLELGGQAEQQVLPSGGSDELHTDGQALVVPAQRQGDGRLTRGVEGRGEGDQLGRSAE